MSEVATTVTAKPAKTVAPVAAPAKPTQTLREAQPKKLPPSSMYSLGQDCDLLAVMVPAEMTYADLVNPVAWAGVCNVVAPNMISKPGKCAYTIHAFAADFVAYLIVDAVTLNNLGYPNGLKVSCVGPSVDPKTGEPMPLDRRTRRPLISE